jgi:branched-chain amino acid transport system ATP-binding protein
MLEVNNIDVKYGKIHVVRGTSFRVDAGEFISIVGSNGAGKSTILKTISGLLRPSNGRIAFLGEEISRLTPHEIVERGISHIPEGRRLFPTLSVLENLELGAYTQRARAKKGEMAENVYSLFPILKERKNQLAGTLSGGEQQMLAIARGLMAAPELLLLDEPSLGLAPFLVRELIKVIKEINSNGTTVLLVEQNIRHALMNSDRGYVLENGAITLEGSGAELLSNENVKTAYLGL